ncbi:MAG: molybdenum cofactor biosynthesis protein MoaE, partial [Pseudomonadales bacterium]
MTPPAVLSVAVQKEDFSIEEALRRLRKAAPGAGAEVAFVGLVRDQAGSVASLTLEH